jgi:hypothetical protein
LVRSRGAAAILVARTSPRLAGAGSINGKAVARGVVWADLKSAGSISADATVVAP